jgi:predicted dehydrogenase
MQQERVEFHIVKELSGQVGIVTEGVRWGVLGTAHIVERSFLPALTAAGGGRIVAVGGRDEARSKTYAAKNGIERTVLGYQALIEDENLDAIYNPLPNGLHAEWTIAALKAGKAVLCEKPLTASLDETRSVLAHAAHSRFPLWEAYVFPFQRQFDRIRQLIDSDSIGPVLEVQSTFHFQLTNRDNIRLSPELAGGALNDVGCYPAHLATLLFGAPVSGVGLARWAPEGVDESAQGVIEYAEGGRLALSCGMNYFTSGADTFSRLIGERGDIRIANPFHPRPGDTVEVRANGNVRSEDLSDPEPTFANIIRHIHGVILGDEEPRHTARDESLPTAATLDILHRSFKSGQVEQSR